MTLPLAAIATLAVLLVAGLTASLWTALEGPKELRETAGHLLVVLSPLLLAVVAAIGVRRTSTKEIDRLVATFLDVSVKQRLEMACLSHADTDFPFPFSRVELARPSNGRSYAQFRLHWAQGQRPPAHVWVKMNVINIEVVARLPVRCPDAAPGPVLETLFIGDHNLDVLTRHPVLRHFHGTIQGAVAEGYQIRAHLEGRDAGHAELQLSLRQKLREHFLSSPYLKRYFAEDVTIAIGVIFSEWRTSRLAPEEA